MSRIQGRPLIENVVSSLTPELRTKLVSLINGTDESPAFRSLVNPSHYITNADKNDVSHIVLETWNKTFTGYLIYNNSFCVLVSYSRHTQDLNLLSINLTNQSYTIIRQALTILELRFVLEESKEAADVVEDVQDALDNGVIKIQDANLETTALEGYVLMSDGEGGVTWTQLGQAEGGDYVATFDNIEFTDNEATINFSGSSDQRWTWMQATDKDCSLVVNLTDGTSLELKRVSYDLSEGDEIITFGGVINQEVGGNGVYKAINYSATFTSDGGKLVKNEVVTPNELEPYAKVDGNYPTMTVGLADNLTPYDEESGAGQNEPFIYQATGTANGTNPLFSTGSYSLLQEKRGNSVVVNQYAKNPDFSDGTNNWYWNTQATSVSVANNIVSFTCSSQYSGIVQSISYIKNHKYLVFAKIKTTSETTSVLLQIAVAAGIYKTKQCVASTNWQFIYHVFDSGDNASNGNITVQDNRSSGWDEIQVKEVRLIDLTQWFNGDIPQDILDNPSNFFRYYQGSLAYNTGHIKNASGRYIKAYGMNQWDEEWEVGGYGSNGEKVANNSVRCKNLIEVIPGQTYYINSPSYIYIWGYDVNGNYVQRIPSSSGLKNRTFDIPSNIKFITFRVEDAYGTTYKHDISINLYYANEPRCLTYEPFEVLTNTDTGTEVLRSAGNVYDSKAPNGLITRRIGVVDLGTLEWTRNLYIAGNFYYFRAILSAGKPGVLGTLSKYFCTKYQAVNVGTPNLRDKTITNFSGNALALIRDDSFTNVEDFKQAMSGVYLYYELAEPTTEQGTPFSENLNIDDFGSMEFTDTDIPQGNLIFYPVDYKAYLDTEYDYTSGDPSNLELKTDTKLLSQIVDSQGNQRFVEGNLTLTNTDFIMNYGKWSLSGTHLMIVCALTSQVVININTDPKRYIATMSLPTFISNKIVEIVGTRVDLKTVNFFENVYTYTGKNIMLAKRTNISFDIMFADVNFEIPANTNARIQFDFLIDAS